MEKKKFSSEDITTKNENNTVSSNKFEKITSIEATANFVAKFSPTMGRLIAKNAFKERTSRLDFHSQDSTLGQSEFRGFFNLAYIAFAYYFLTNQLQKIVYEGTLVGLEVIWNMFSRFEIIPTWLVLVGISWSAFVLQKMILKGYVTSDWVAISLQHTFQMSVFVYGVSVSLYLNLPTIQTGFLLMEMLVLLMKMHSYIVTNREFANNLKSKKKMMITPFLLDLPPNQLLTLKM